MFVKLDSIMFLAYIVLYKLFTPGICEQKRELTEYREEFNGLFDQLVSEVTSHIQEDVTYDAILWMKLVIFATPVILIYNFTYFLSDYFNTNSRLKFTEKFFLIVTIV